MVQLKKKTAVPGGGLPDGRWRWAPTEDNKNGRAARVAGAAENCSGLADGRAGVPDGWTAAGRTADGSRTLNVRGSGRSAILEARNEVCEPASDRNTGDLWQAPGKYGKRRIISLAGANMSSSWYNMASILAMAITTQIDGAGRVEIFHGEKLVSKLGNP